MDHLLLHRYVLHRDLHSFPTRRSSDLASVSSSPLVCSDCVPPSTAASAWMVTRTRSEEHTSELQSLRQLVCRLLLEKKKKIKTSITDVINSVILLTWLIGIKKPVIATC